jgi:flagellar protein FliS
MKLVNILYRAALESVGAARRHLAAGEIRERSRQISKGWELLHELAGSLDHERGGDLSRNLSDLYVYMQNRLLEANMQQKDAPLAEVETLLTTLAEAWTAVKLPAPIVEESDYQPLSCVY